MKQTLDEKELQKVFMSVIEEGIKQGTETPKVANCTDAFVANIGGGLYISVLIDSQQWVWTIYPNEFHPFTVDYK